MKKAHAQRAIFSQETETKHTHTYDEHTLLEHASRENTVISDSHICLARVVAHGTGRCRAQGIRSLAEYRPCTSRRRSRIISHRLSAKIAEIFLFLASGNGCEYLRVTRICEKCLLPRQVQCFQRVDDFFRRSLMHSKRNDCFCSLAEVVIL